MGKRRVVITGMGVISPVGNNVKETWEALLSGKNGAAPITLFDTSDYETKFACEVKNYDPLEHFDRKELRRLDRFSQFAILAAEEALNDSGMELDKEDRDRIGVIVGSGIGGMLSFEDEHTKLVTRGPRRVSPFFIPNLIIDIAAGHISIKYGLKGPNFATVSACATAAHSIGTAMRTIQYGDAEVMICGGAEAAIVPSGIAGFNAMKAISTRNEDPQKASRPFDAKRDGFVMGEGGGILILEELEHARARGAKIYAELVGVGFTADAFHITQPAPGGEGAIRAMKAALKDANLQPTDVQYINAHGTSTYFNDKNETEAIKSVFGDYAYELVVSSTKSMTGHLLGASGVLELIATSLTVQQNKVHPTVNYEFPDPACDLNYVPNTPIEKEVNAALSNSFGFGGHNVTLCVKKFME
ncbi:3-oxoacyl-(acyl-carrier-protein) synthase 2 [Caldithrix abyssi DSM 13497]|uniref:3-oxoacyl-[acyl-carrier-protein] synthase 2 n=1 Tax=Caldithrix abyssi DSM 13497 TaxID=880073 RepID=H1XS95_CALAY|nr:beta-ketoacyl-ACP synthase II [Caldithrix abyssi]APF20201.1 3-oxoacyl-(acyl-carrier-protein) synthase II [Caldithrix abyssi DSM 13497]EHO40259.1 3-oxoacyl-(acyl-carrier-protein) synthase 2 [Caldithrix abyssi DSM 13497]